MTYLPRMPDHVTPERRSFIMSQVGTRDTKPELIIRCALHRLGFRFRLHQRALPGSPDLVFPVRRKVIFVHGCFWHGHGCRWGQLPKSRPDYWGPKIAANKKRDATSLHALHERGWRTHVVWQCDLREPDAALEKAIAFLDG
jgi:DNA mismatch endonuclease (patch repair protein)